MEESIVEQICRQYLDKLHYEGEIIYWGTNMFYANNYCTYTETTNPHTYIYEGECRECKKEVKVSVPGEALHKYEQGGYIQDVMSMLSSDDREFLISGTCGKCWDELFEEDTDKENADETE